MNTFDSTRHAKFLLDYHFVWIPKYRRCVLGDAEIKKLINHVIDELAEEHNFKVLNLEIMPDHIHLFFPHSLNMPPVN